MAIFVSKIQRIIPDDYHSFRPFSIARIISAPRFFEITPAELLSSSACLLAPIFFRFGATTESLRSRSTTVFSRIATFFSRTFTVICRYLTNFRPKTQRATTRPSTASRGRESSRIKRARPTRSDRDFARDLLVEGRRTAASGPAGPDAPARARGRCCLPNLRSRLLRRPPFPRSVRGGRDHLRLRLAAEPTVTRERPKTAFATTTNTRCW